MANLRRLIDLDEIKPIYFPSTEMDGLDVVNYLNTLPTVDVVEVIHAYWVGDDPGDWHCSHCGEYAADGGFEQTKYCPNCGAKMDGGSNG